MSRSAGERANAPEVTPIENSKSAPELGRTLQRRHILLIALGGVIGAGLFVGSSASISAVGPAVIFSYVAAGLISYSLMAMIGELAAHYSKVQAFTELIRVASGPGLGFVVGWTYWYLWVVAIAIEALGGAALLQSWVPLPVWAISGLLVLVMTAVNLLSTRSFGEFEFWFSSIKVVTIIGFIVIGLIYCFGSAGAREVTWRNLTSYEGFVPHGAISVLTGIVTVFFSLTGAELTTVAAAESSDPAATARLAPALLGRIVLFYVGSVFLIVCIVPWNLIIPGQSPFTMALKAMGFRWAEWVMTVVIITALLSCLNSAFYVTSRTMFRLAANGYAPAPLIKLDARRVPTRSVLLSSFTGLLCLALGVLWPKTAFAFLVNASGTLILFVYLGVCFAYLSFRRNSASPPGHRRLPMVIPYLLGAVILAVLAAVALSGDLLSQLLASAAPIGLLSLAYLWLRRACV